MIKTVCNLSIAAVQNGVATLNEAFSAGTYQLSAAYNGDDVFASSAGSLFEVVNSPAHSKTTTTISSSANPSTYGQPVTFTVTVSTTSGIATGEITFNIGSINAVVKLSNTEEAAFTTSALPEGSVIVSAIYSGDATHAGSTSPILVTCPEKPVHS